MTEFSPSLTAEGRPPRHESSLPAHRNLQLFAPDQEKIQAMAPSLDSNLATLGEFMAKLRYLTNPDAENIRNAAERLSEENDGKAYTTNRSVLRKTVSDREANRKLLFSGGILAASYEDLEEGLAATKSAYMRLSGGLLDQVHQVDFFKDGIEGCAIDIFTVRKASQDTAAEVAAAIEDDFGQRYELLKALSARDTGLALDGGSPNAELLPSEAVLTLSVMAKSPIRQELATELDQGTFDTVIARDILEFVDGNQDVNGDLAKVRQFAKFVTAFADTSPDTKAAMYERMAARLDEWPEPQLEVVQEARQALLNSMNENFSRAGVWLQNNKLAGRGNLEEGFQDAVTGALRIVAKKVQLDPRARLALMQAGINIHGNPRRGKQKRQGQTRQQITPPATEVVSVNPEIQPEPLKLMTYNLNDYTTTDGVEDLVNGFIESTRPGDTALREDLAKMFDFMVRTDLPPTHRRGVKPIRATQVRFGEDLLDFSEFKPTEAAGLPLKTRTAKESRVYFIKPDDETIGVIGLEPRSEQNNFINRIRNKLREHR